MTCLMQHKLVSRQVCKTGKSKETSPAPHHAVCGCIEYQCPAVLSLCVCLAALRWHLLWCCLWCVCLCVDILIGLIVCKSGVMIQPPNFPSLFGQTRASYLFLSVGFASQSSSSLLRLPAVLFEVFSLSLLFLLRSHLVWSQWGVPEDCFAQPHCRAWAETWPRRPFTSI